mmetsp:Transcript_17395/g.29839  ORF Transcript_17395/g.29839 Transcript_17395/m.29839 type:complete len:200 (+) Transcript_17395:1242-1841(+)
MVHSASTPSCTRPSTRSWIGRSRMRATPSNTNRPRPAAATAAVRGRMAVPALPRDSSAPVDGKRPPHPTTTISPCSQRSSSLMPRVLSALTMYRMSSESSRFLTNVVPSERAASSRMRLDRDLEPGNLTVPEMTLMGRSTSCSATCAGAAYATPRERQERRAVCSLVVNAPAATRPCCRLGATMAERMLAASSLLIELA